MTTSWLDQQNVEPAITFRAASDRYWSQVQFFRSLEALLVVAVPVALAIAAQFIPALVTWASVFGLSMTIIDTALIYPLIGLTRLKAASAQDTFDSLAYALPRPLMPYISDEDRSEIRRSAQRQQKSRAERNHDWYSPELGSLPLRFGRLACLRESVAWDGGLRRRYAITLSVILVLVFVVIVAYGAVGQITGPELVVKVLYPLLPAIVWAGREQWDQFDSVQRVNGLRRQIHETWTRALNGQVSDRELDAFAVTYQTRLFSYRERTAPVPDFFYAILRGGQSAAMQGAALDVVREYDKSKAATRNPIARSTTATS